MKETENKRLSQIRNSMLGVVEVMGEICLLKVDALNLQLKKPGSELNNLIEVNKFVRNRARI